MRKILCGFMASLALFSLVGCQSSVSKPPLLAGQCNRDVAAGLKGQPALGDAEAKRLTGATTVRQLQKGQPMTMDFRPDRLTIENNRAGTRIISASCV